MSGGVLPTGILPKTYSFNKFQSVVFSLQQNGKIVAEIKEFDDKGTLIKVSKIALGNIFVEELTTTQKNYDVLRGRARASEIQFSQMQQGQILGILQDLAPNRESNGWKATLTTDISTNQRFLHLYNPT